MSTIADGNESAMRASSLVEQAFKRQPTKTPRVKISYDLGKHILPPDFPVEKSQCII